MKVNILEKHKEIQNAISSGLLDESTFWSNAHKRTREWLVLGASALAKKRQGIDCPTSAMELDPPNPDFQTYTEAGEKWGMLEVTECVPEGWKRTSHYKKVQLGIHYTNTDACSVTPEQVVEVISARISAKSQMAYAGDSFLIIYFNIGILRKIGPEYGPLCDILSAEHQKISKGPFRRVYILDSEMMKIFKIE
jgi:hypothetical protein